MGLHGAEDEMQVVGRNALAVFLLEHVECLVGIAPAISDVSGLHFPIVDQVLVRLTAGGELVAERVIRRRQLGQRGLGLSS